MLNAFLSPIFFAAYAHHSFFSDMMGSLGRGLMYGFGFKIMRALSLPGAIALVLVVLAVASAVTRRA